MNRLLHQIAFLLILQVCPTISDWVPYKGLWYYISAPGEERNYTAAVTYCASLHSHLATIVDLDQESFLISHLHDGLHWIGLSTIRTEHDCGGDEMVWARDYECSINFIKNRTKLGRAECSAFALKNTGNYFGKYLCVEKIKFICQWQCHTLAVTSKNDPTITSIYEQQYYELNRTRYHGIKLTRLQYLRYERSSCLFKCLYRWSFELGNYETYVAYIDDYSPYNHFTWIVFGKFKTKTINFVCVDCSEYEIIFKEGHLKHTSRLRKNLEYGYNYTNTNVRNSSSFWYNQGTSLWCYSQLREIHICFNYNIFPVGYWYVAQINSSIQLNIACVSMKFNNDPDINQFSTTSTTSTQFSTIQLVSTTKQETPITQDKESTTPEHPYTKDSASTTTRSVIATSISKHTTNRTSDHVSTSALHSATYPNNDFTTATDLKSGAYEDNILGSKTYIAIGVSVGVVILIVIVVIIGVFLYRRRLGSKNTSETITQNLDDVHVITDTNIYSEQPSVRQRPTSTVRNGLSDPTHTAGTFPNIPTRNHIESKRRAVPVPDPNVNTNFQSHNRVGDKASNHGSTSCTNDHANHGSSNIQIYSEINKQKKPVPSLPTEPVYSQVSNKAKTVKSKHEQDNIQHNGVNGSDSDIEFCDNDVYESKGALCSRTHENTGDHSDEEFSDNELYERGTPAPGQRQTNVKTNVFDNTAFNVDPDDEHIEMVDNDVYGQG